MPPPLQSPSTSILGAPHATSEPLDVTSLHDAHADFVWASLFRLGVAEADLPDMLQEVFLVVHRKLATFDGSSKVTTWLFGICVRVAAARRRRAFVRHEVPTLVVPEPPVDAAHQPDALAEEAHARRELGLILDTLDPDKRVVFCMFELEEMSCEAIAELLSVPVGTVYSRLHAARRAFERALERRAAIRHARGEP